VAGFLTKSLASAQPRSVKEAARAWLGDLSGAFPSAIASLLDNHSDFTARLAWTAEPEMRVKIDSFRGERPNIDVLVRLKDEFGSAVLLAWRTPRGPFGISATRDALAQRKREGGQPVIHQELRIQGRSSNSSA